MMKIGTHNSCTGERSRSWYHMIMIPFARCQTKTLVEQYECGCRYFDIRVKKNKKAKHENERFIACHGLWQSAIPIADLIHNLDFHCVDPDNTDDIAYFQITFECDEVTDDMIEYFTTMFGQYPHFRIAAINQKTKGKWIVLHNDEKAPGAVQAFVPLDGTTYHTLIPIPWLWKKIYHDKPEFGNVYYSLVDFL